VTTDQASLFDLPPAGPPTPRSTLPELRAWLDVEVAGNGKEGQVCPVCDRRLRLYERKLNSGMVACLLMLYRAAGRDYAHIRDVADTPGREQARLRHWGLLEPSPAVRDDGGPPGTYRVTELGERFVRGQLAVPKMVFTLRGVLVGASEERVTVHEALGDAFSYIELLGLNEGIA
jgi:hypothetical protein